MKRTFKNQDILLPWKVFDQLKINPKTVDDIVGNLCIKRDIYAEMVIFLREDIELILEKLLIQKFITKTQEGYYSIVQTNLMMKKRDQDPSLTIDLSAAE